MGLQKEGLLKDVHKTNQKSPRGRKNLQSHKRYCSQISFCEQNNKTIALVVQESATDSRVIVLDSNAMKLKATLFFPS